MGAERSSGPPITVEQYRAIERASLDTRHEYIDGSLSAMAGGSRRHSRIDGNAFAAVAVAVGDGPCQVYNSDIRIRLSEHVQVYADVAVSCDERDEETAEEDEIAFPRLVVEVLSPHTERVDRGRKLRHYQACPSVQEYALVNSDYQAVEVYRRGAEWTYHRYEAGSEVALVSIDARIPIAAFYYRTALAATPEAQ